MSKLKILITITFVGSLGVAGFLLRQPQEITQAVALAKVKNLLVSCDVPEPHELSRAVYESGVGSTPFWMLKVRGAGETYTCLVDAQTGDVRSVVSTLEAERLRGRGRTGASYYTSVAHAQSHSLQRITRFTSVIGLSVQSCILKPDKYDGRGRCLPGEHKLSYRYSSTGFPFLIPAVRGSIVFDNQDGALVRYQGARKGPLTSVLPVSLISRDQACAKAFGKVIPRSKLESEEKGWILPKGQSHAQLSFLFVSKQGEAVGVDAKSGVIIYRAVKRG